MRVMFIDFMWLPRMRLVDLLPALISLLLLEQSLVLMHRC